MTSLLINQYFVVGGLKNEKTLNLSVLILIVLMSIGMIGLFIETT